MRHYIIRIKALSLVEKTAEKMKKIKAGYRVSGIGFRVGTGAFAEGYQ